MATPETRQSQKSPAEEIQQQRYLEHKRWHRRRRFLRSLAVPILVLAPVSALCSIVFLQHDPRGWLWGFSAGFPEWSPDGKRLVFRCDQEDVYDGAVCTRAADNPRERRLVRPWSGFYTGIRSSFSPDGKKILSSGFGVRLLNPDGTGEVTLDDGGYTAVFSPDGSRIAYDGMMGSIYVVNADGSGKYELGYGDNPAWSPDGKRILYDNGYTLFDRNADGKGPRRRLAEGTQGVWSPDGKRIAFLMGNQSFYGGSIYIMDADGSNRKRLTMGTSDRRPRWSPSSKSLAFVRDGYDVCLLYPDEGGSIHFFARGTDPSFSPDGKRLAFATTDGGGTSGVRVIDLEFWAR